MSGEGSGGEGRGGEGRKREGWPWHLSPEAERIAKPLASTRNGASWPFAADIEPWLHVSTSWCALAGAARCGRAQSGQTFLGPFARGNGSKERKEGDLQELLSFEKATSNPQPQRVCRRGACSHPWGAGCDPEVYTV